MPNKLKYDDIAGYIDEVVVNGADFVLYNGEDNNPHKLTNKRKKFVLKNVETNRSAHFSSIKKAREALQRMADGDDEFDLWAVPVETEIVETKGSTDPAHHAISKRVNLTVAETIEEIIPFREIVKLGAELARNAKKTIGVDDDGDPIEVPDVNERGRNIRWLGEMAVGKAPAQVIHTHQDGSGDSAERLELTPEMAQFAIKRLAMTEEGLKAMQDALASEKDLDDKE